LRLALLDSHEYSGMATDVHRLAQVRVRVANPGASHEPARRGAKSPMEALVRAFLVGLGLGIVVIAGPSEAWSIAAVGFIAIGSALLSWDS
jgi:hypothetical protein